MYCGVYAPWDHAPKFLRQSEVRDPFIVLKGFFDINDVHGHIARLKIWRHYVISFDYYLHERFGPGNLLYDYEFNVRFLEAVFLLLLDDQEASFDSEKITADHLTLEEDTWDWYPVDFTKEELFKPFLVVKAAFDEFEPEVFRNYLWEWITAALSTSAINEFTSPAEIITVFEHLTKLYAAAWLIFQRKTNGVVLTNTKVKSDANLSESAYTTLIEPKLDIVDQSASQSPATKLALKEIAKAIVGITPMVKSIILIGTTKEPFGYILYILIDDLHYELSYLLNQVIEHAVRPLKNISTVVESAKRATQRQSADRRFLNWSLKNGTVIYEADTLKLDALRKDLIKNDPITTSEKPRLTLATLYYKEVGHHFRKKDFCDALQAVHKTIEAAISEFLDIKTGFETTIPNLGRLITLTLIIDSKIYDWFTEHRRKYPELYHLIDHVYPEDERKKLMISEEEIMELMQEASDLLILISDLLNQ